jgi:putative membrane protein
MEKWVALMIFMMSLVMTFLGCGTNSSGNTENINRGNFANTRVGSNNVLQANANAGNAAAASSESEKFWTDAALGGMTEVELARLASTKAQSADVKSFAQMMITDHSKANEELKSIAQQKHVTLPTALDSEHQAMVTKLQGLSGAAFDKQYVSMMVEDHEKDVADFQKQSNNSSDPEAKSFASKTLPTLQKHLETIKGIQSKMH